MDEIDFACSHILREFGLGNVKFSLAADFDTLKKAHDSIHEFWEKGSGVFLLRLRTGALGKYSQDVV